MFVKSSSLKKFVLNISRVMMLVFLTSTISLGQSSLLSFQNSEKLSYKKALKKGRSDQSPILAILYSPSYATIKTNQFVDAKKIISDAGVIPVVIDWANHLNQKPQKRVNVENNPMWLYIHPDDIIIAGEYQIQTDKELQDFLTKNKSLYTILEQAIKENEESKTLNSLLQLADVSTNTIDAKYISKQLNNYLKQAPSRALNNKNLQSVVRIATKSPISKRVHRVISERKNRAMALTSVDTVYNILRANIDSELKITDQFYPYEVWQRYEKELGFKADSLYRIFALRHFSKIPGEQQTLYNESFDFINLYPRASWDLLDVLYGLIVPKTTKKEDLEMLLDLISFQIFREESYRQLDYKAVLLYKLGEKERALGMVAQINTKATEKKIKYKSMLYSMKK